ncbi:tyrosinase central domain-containing protein [Colletotrichum phormii]|uniref:Tyrosinase central domain-containing protein n=1 Tax=Colletotrichum phormii TaxID=359342 RepID=A0AAJ0A685_9PEZI|nr:tyrosinase central domain-containing protein [Colletotrichum phormii]KAK1655826.1 tyrosinase central domain-containing protein [Colletotrichum phormii]
MAVLKHCVWLLFAAGNAALTSAKTTAHNFTQTAIDNGDALAQLSAQALEVSKALNQRMGINSTCTPDKLRVRKRMRKAYVAAVKCLQSSPTLLNSTELPAAKSLYDDFVLTHLNQTGMIHVTANFLLWHRHFTYTYEENLRNVCGYTGTFPYWEWGLDVEDPANNGGGCVETGPFSDMVVHVGPRLLWQYGTTTPLSVDKPTEDHPRCLTRDLNKHIASRYSSLRNTTELILGNDNIEWFQAVGVHGGGHYTIGGDPGAYPFIFPGEPVFFLHHAQVDRVYWIWQMLDFANRQDIFGTRTLQNNPPSANATLDDLIDIAPIGGSAKLRDLMNTVGGSPFCYVYE